MSRIISLIAVVLLTVSLKDRTIQAAPPAPATQPSLEQQNADLRDLVSDYCKQLDLANGKLKFEEQRNETLKSQMAQLVSQAKAYEQTIPIPTRSALPPAINADSVLGSFNYNGQTVYLVGPTVARFKTSPVTSRKSQTFPYRQMTTEAPPAEGEKSVPTKP